MITRPDDPGAMSSCSAARVDGEGHILASLQRTKFGAIQYPDGLGVTKRPTEALREGCIQWQVAATGN
jgi:hypothetical protein